MESIPLTSGRSMAQDRKIYWRKGIMGFINTKIPDFSRRSTVGAKTPMSRFFIDQDTGGAIKGEARADLYWGYGTKAKFLAENLDDYGDLVFFIKKN
jgi:membrane-bound lytic murein transglycosylase A